MDRDGRKILFNEQVGESDATLNCLDKDDHLNIVKLKTILVYYIPVAP